MFTVWQALADLVTEKDLNEGRLYPSLSTIGDVSFKLAVRVRAQWSHINWAEALDHVFVPVHLYEGLWNCNKIQSSQNLCVTDHGVRLWAQHGDASPGAVRQRGVRALPHLQHRIWRVCRGLVPLACRQHDCAVVQTLTHWTQGQTEPWSGTGNYWHAISSQVEMLG